MCSPVLRTCLCHGVPAKVLGPIKCELHSFLVLGRESLGQVGLHTFLENKHH